MGKQIKIIIHASNVHGPGASNVSISLIDAFYEHYMPIVAKTILPQKGILADYLIDSPSVKRYKRYLPNSISRIFECTFSILIFKRNYRYIVLGDIPLYGIPNQVILVHQSNLVYPEFNRNSSRSLSFRVHRFLFKRNLRFVKKIIVQTEIMEKELLASYPILKNRIKVVPQPLPRDFVESEKKTIENNKSTFLKLFYPAAGYHHKNHKFLLKIAEELKHYKIDFKIFLTLDKTEFKPLKHLNFVENLGRIPSKDMKNNYYKFHSLLFLSKAESYGLPLVEAMSIGMPIVTIDLAYARWMCENDAYYFEEDNVNSFLGALQMVKNKTFNQITYSEPLKKFPTTWKNVVDKFIQEVS